MTKNILNSRGLLLCTAAAVLFTYGCKGSFEKTVREDNIPAPDGYFLVWHDEFDGHAIDKTKWIFMDWAPGRVNDELQRYVPAEGLDGKRTAYQEKGALHIRAMKHGDEVISARINSAASWEYGYMEARIQLPKGKGTWPAFWMMPDDMSAGWPACGEIDILEEVGYNPDYTSSSIHCKDYNHVMGTQKTAERLTSGAEEGYHIYALEWTANYIKTYVDGEQLLEFRNDGAGNDATWPFNKPFFITLNLAWGGSWGGARGIEESALPATIKVDYVRVFRKDGTEQKIDKLISKMTLREKAGQLNQLSAGGDLAEAARMGEVGSILNCVDPNELNRIQKAAVEESRLGIPILASRDVIHGFKTIFPVPLGMAASFDPQLVEKGARIAALEATAAGIRWTFSPMLDIARDPRWGRVAEGSGEDVLLDTEMARAMVRGYQGGGEGDPTAMAACVKHFVGYGAAEGGRDYNSTGLTERLLRNVYLPPFKAAIDEGAWTLMTSFNDNDGIPSTGNRWLLTDLLRDEWGFDGMVVTDWNSSGEMVDHGFAADNKDAARISLGAGVDMDMMSYGFISHIEELVASGAVSEDRIDDAVRNVLRLKFRLGLFDNPYVDAAAAAKACYTEEALEAAKMAAIEGTVLLKNDGTLPLRRRKTILVTGPMADAPYEQLGTWAFDGEADHSVTPLSALQDRFNVIYEPGLAYTRDMDKKLIARAADAAGKADAVVAFVGEEAILSGEAHSMSDLRLKGAQSELLKALAATGKPVVCVVVAGRPLAIGEELEMSNAMLYSFHPGTMGGEALAALISGEAVPSGKLPMTFLHNAGEAPTYYNHNNTGRPNTGTEVLLADIPVGAGQTSLGCRSYYLDSGYGPLLPFGYGLSYTTFEYGEVSLDKKVYGAGDTVRVRFELRNTGARDGVEVAQLYVRDLVGSVTRPVKELKGFRRVTVPAGGRVRVEMELPVADLAFWGADMQLKVEPGDFLLWVAGDSASGEPVRFSVE